jgi:hypothetical protein
VAVTPRVPRWTLELTAVPASAAIGTPATLTAVTNNILNGTPLYHINISAGGTVFKRCKKNTCTVSLAAGEGLTTYEADVSAVHSKKAVVSAAADVDRTRPTCTGNECM